MKQGDLIIAWSKVIFIYDAELPGGFLKAVDYSTTNYLANGKLGENQMYHKNICRPVTPAERADYGKAVDASRYKKHILQTELI